MTINGPAGNKCAAEAVRELSPLLTGGRIERLENLDERTLIMSVYRKKPHTVVVSVSKRSPGVFLFTKTLRPEYLYSSVKTSYMSRFLKGSKLTDVLCVRQGVVFTGRGANDFLFIVDFSVSDIALADQAGRVIASLFGRFGETVRYSPSPAGLCAREEEGTHVSDGLSARFFEERNGTLIAAVMKTLNTEEKKIGRLLLKLSQEDTEAQQGERYRRWGDLLKYNLETVPSGASSVLLQDFEGKSETVPLDPRMTARRNMERYFARYQKMKRRKRGSSERVEEEKKAVQLIETLKKRITGEELVGLDLPPSVLLKAPEIEALGRGLSLRLEKVLTRAGKKTKKKAEEKKPYLVLSTSSGKRVFVGRNASENDELVRRVARGNDLWFHAEGVSGSHVLLRYEKRGGFTENDVRDACMLALHFSKFRDQKSGPIVYTFCKWVKKRKQARVGHVEYFNNKTKMVTMDDEVLAGLLGRSQAP
jgi:predicted ribosome quality control (RQC) complex YloA/Tae2 family protein